MEYQAHAFHDGFAKGRASGVLLISPQEILFSADEQSVRLPLAQARFELGGASDRLVFIRHPEYPDWTLYTSDRSILANPTLHLDEAIQRQLRKARHIRRFNWSVLVLVVLLVVGTPTLLLTQMDWVSGQVARQIPASWEIKLGQSVFAQYRMGHEFLETDAAQETLAQLTAPLLDAVDDPRNEYRIYISNEAALNAFALPGGYIVINAGLILAAGSASELLGVLAHEITHVREQHGVRGLIQAAGNFAVVQALFGDVSGVLATVAGAAPLLLNQSYSRDFEREADEQGLALLEQARIDPRGLISFFEKLIEQEKKRLAEIEDADTRDLVGGAMDFISSHPATTKRIEALKQRIEDSPQDYRNLDAEFARLQALVAEFMARHGAEPTDSDAINNTDAIEADSNNTDQKPQQELK